MLLGSLLGNLGAVTSSPLAKAATRYWWVSLPLAYVAWSAYRKRKTKPEMDWHGLVGDVAPAMTIALSVIMLDLMLRGQATPVAGLAGAPAPPPMKTQASRLAPERPTVTDAVFTPNTPQQTVDSEDPHGL